MLLQTLPPPQTSEAMMRLLDALLAITILINLVKGAELILRPHQQKWLQGKSDSLALWLEYSRPVGWYTKPKNALRVHWLAAAILILVTGVSGSIYGDARWWLRVLIFLGTLLTVGGMLLEVFVGDDEILRLGPEKAGSMRRTLDKWETREMVIEDKVRDWLLSSSKIAVHLLKQALLTLVAIIGLSAFLGILYLFLRLVRSFENSEYRLWKVLLFAALLMFLARIFKEIASVAKPIVSLGIVASMSFVITIMLLISELILKFARAIVWRIAEYNKGAFAAILLVFTVLLGMAEAYFRFLKK